MSDLLDRVRPTIRRRHTSYQTERSYVGWVERFVRYHAREAGRFVHPRHLREPDVEALLNPLANDRARPRHRDASRATSLALAR